MIIVKSREEIELMRESALIVSKTLGMLAGEVKEGVTPLYLDKLAETSFVTMVPNLLSWFIRFS
jgi:methionyl aminopeptidase